MNKPLTALLPCLLLSLLGSTAVYADIIVNMLPPDPVQEAAPMPEMAPAPVPVPAAAPMPEPAPMPAAAPMPEPAPMPEMAPAPMPEPAPMAAPEAVAEDDAPFMDDDEFGDDEVASISDPLEPVNRAMFWVNDKLYFYLLKPVAHVFRLVPEPGRISLQNFFSNLGTPVRLINSGLQGKMNAVGTEAARFGINTTVGILGFFDPARTHFDLEKQDEDTGQTFGVWGMGQGAYLVLPFYGPSSVRDGIGLIGDGAMDPLTYLLDEERRDYIGAKFVNAANNVSIDKDTYESIIQDALDPYLFIRDAYAQHRAGKVAE